MRDMGMEVVAAERMWTVIACAPSQTHCASLCSSVAPTHSLVMHAPAPRAPFVYMCLLRLVLPVFV